VNETNETNTMADREKLLAAIRMWLQGQRQKEKQKSIEKGDIQ